MKQILSMILVASVVLMGQFVYAQATAVNPVATAQVTGQQAMAAASQLFTDAKAAIAASASKPTVKEKTDFLVAQAQGFMNTKNYQEAATVVNYVLSKLDANSPQAKSILDQAKAQLSAKMQGAMSNAMNKLGVWNK